VTWPTLIVEANDGPAGNRTANVSWQNITPYVKRISYKRGRQRQLGRWEAGTISLLLDNADGRFDPQRTSSPPYSRIWIPGQALRVRATHSATTYPLAQAFVRSWLVNDLIGNALPSVSVECTDALGFLSLSGNLNATTVDGATTNTLVTSVYNAIYNNGGATVTGSDIRTGNSQLGAYTLSANGFALATSAVDTEDGSLFVAGDGDLTFLNRHARLNTTTVSATFGFTGSRIPFERAPRQIDDSEYLTEVQITRRDGGTQTVASADFPRRAYSRTTLHRTDADALGLAEYLYARYSVPATRLDSVVIDGAQDNDTYWPILLGLEIGQRVATIFTPWAGQPSIDVQSIVQSIKVDIVPNANWKIQLGLAQADLVTYWVLDDAIRSVLDTTTRLAY
jgi:hypothetical protein